MFLPRAMRNLCSSLLLATLANPVLAGVDNKEAVAAYVLGANDEIRVSIFGAYPIEVKTRIKEDGRITLPSIGDVVAEGSTTNALANNIRRQLQTGGYFVDPIVNVEVVSFVSRSVTMFGNLQNPGLYPLDRPQTIAMMLARTGGARADAADYAILQRTGEADRRIALAGEGIGPGGARRDPADRLGRRYLPAFVRLAQHCQRDRHARPLGPGTGRQPARDDVGAHCVTRYDSVPEVIAMSR